jgi:hypothetical protein
MTMDTTLVLGGTGRPAGGGERLQPGVPIRSGLDPRAPFDWEKPETWA